MLVNCSVCLGDINLFEKEGSILNCGHFFHANCLNDWLKQQMNCPECRAVVTRGNFAMNLFPKVSDEIRRQLKALENKSDDLKIENFFLKIENSWLKDG